MAITLSEETQQLIEERMKRSGCATADEFLQRAVCQYDPVQVLYYEDLNEETRAAIEVAEQQIDAGQGIPWEEAKATLRTRFAKKH